MIFPQAGTPVDCPPITGAVGETHGTAARSSGPDAVRYMSVHSWKQPDSHGHSGTSQGPEQQPARPGIPSSRAISAGSGRSRVRTWVGEADGFTDIRQ